MSRYTHKLINRSTINKLKRECYIINTCRGTVIDDGALIDALKEKRIAGAALDVFEEEPYKGSLSELDNVLLTPHMSSCSHDCRAQMELEATEEVIRYFQGEPLQNKVPEEEYVYQE